jgi:integrase
MPQKVKKPLSAKKLNLSDVVIKNLFPSDKETMFKDGGGLFVNVNPNGSKYFQLRYTFEGKQKKIQIGKYPDMSLQEARIESLRIRLLINSGIDPSMERKKDKARGRVLVETTFEVVAERWLFLKKSMVSESYHIKIAGTIRSNCYRQIGSLPVQQITTPIIVNTLRVIQGRGALRLMHDLKSYLRQIFDFAKAETYFLGDNPVDCLQRSVLLEPHHPKSYNRIRTPIDMGVFLNLLESYEGEIKTKLLIKLQLLTAVRPSEARLAVWSEFDLTHSIWSIPAERMKQARDHIIPLSSQAIAVLQQIKALSGHSIYLFPSSRAGSGNVSDGTVNKALRTIWTKYRIQAHGFRHFFSTEANESGLFPKEMIETALSHGDPDRIRGTYNFATYLDKRRVLGQWYADYLDELRNLAEDM